jgi:NTP pyrophosphatase (non-canonical NTP hydrolase)
MSESIRNLLNAAEHEPTIAAELDEVVAQINSIAYEHGIKVELTFEEFVGAFRV